MVWYSSLNLKLENFSLSNLRYASSNEAMVPGKIVEMEMAL